MSFAPIGWSATTGLIPILWSPRTRALQPCPRPPMRLPSGARSGSATPSPPMVPTAVTTSGSAYRAGGVGVGAAPLQRAGSRRPQGHLHRRRLSGTCPGTYSATGCCCRTGSAWLRPSTPGTSSRSRSRSRPGGGYAERQRLFDLPSSSWADYDRNRISVGGGVLRHTVKSIRLSPQTRNVLDVDAAELTPAQLIQAILRAPVDLLWNGGIGTLVRGRTRAPPKWVTGPSPSAGRPRSSRAYRPPAGVAARRRDAAHAAGRRAGAHPPGDRHAPGVFEECRARRTARVERARGIPTSPRWCRPTCRRRSDGAARATSPPTGCAGRSQRRCWPTSWSIGWV